MADRLKKEFLEEILAEIIPTLQCAVCLKVPAPNDNKRFVSVKTGKSVCEDCTWRGLKVTKTVSPVVQKLAEILPYYCHNYPQCQAIYADVVQLEDHQKSCPFRWIPCAHQFVGHCKERIIQKNWRQHFQDVHDVDFDDDYDLREPEEIAKDVDFNMTFSQGVYPEDLEPGAYWRMELIEIGYSRFALQRCIKGGIFCAWIVCLETEYEAKNFEYTISVEDRQGKKITYHGICSTPENFEDDVGRNGLYFTMTTSAVQHFGTVTESKMGMGFELEVKVTNMKGKANIKHADVESGISSSSDSSSSSSDSD